MTLWSSTSPAVTFNGGGTAVRLPCCPVCGGWPHEAGIAACPEVVEVEFDSYGAVRRIVKRQTASQPLSQ